MSETRWVERMTGEMDTRDERNRGREKEREKDSGDIERYGGLERKRR